jgi:predicted nuclease of predicted toxin-antitoxin system
VKFLVDRCAGRKLAEHLSAAGHDVLRANDLGPDPGDEALLQKAHADGRILITIDTDFSALLFLKQISHSGLVRLPDVPPQRRIELIDLVLHQHSEDLAHGCIVTVRGGRIRISHQPSKFDDLP